MTPRRYRIALTLTCVISVAFYSWLLYAVFAVPLRWVFWIMGGTSVALAVSVVRGYRLWLARGNYDSLRRDSTPPLPQLVGILPMAGVALLAWSAAYSYWRNAHLTAWVLGLSAVGLSVVAAKEMRGALSAGPSPTLGSPEPLVFDPTKRLNVYALGCIAVMALLGAAVFLYLRGYVIAVLLSAVFAALCPWLVRRITGGRFL